jgi:hypothetical protein
MLREIRRLIPRKKGALIAIVLLIYSFEVLYVTSYTNESPVLGSRGSIRYNEVTPLHTAGKLLKNAQNETVYLRGVALGDLSWRTTFQGNVETRIRRLLELTNGKVTAIRVAISHNPHTYGFVLDDPDVFNPAVDELVRVCVKYGLYLFTNFHGTSIPELISEFKTDPTRFIDWHLHFIERYKAVPNFVGVELYNEPHGYTQDELRVLVTQAYDAIRAANPEALVIVPSHPYAEVHDDWIANPLGPQAVYSWDSYYSKWAYAWYQKPYDDGDYALGKTRMEQHFIRDKHIDAELPIIATEYGFLPDDNLQACEDYYDTINFHNNSWVCWQWWQEPKNYGLATDHTYATLTPHGEILRDQL